jgi:hypothetical protein
MLRAEIAMRAAFAFAFALPLLAPAARADRGTVSVHVVASRSGMIEIDTVAGASAGSTHRPIGRASVTLRCVGHEHRSRTSMRGVASFALHHAPMARLMGVEVTRPGFQGLSVDGDVRLPERGPLVVRLPAGGCSSGRCRSTSFSFPR